MNISRQNKQKSIQKCQYSKTDTLWRTKNFIITKNTLLLLYEKAGKKRKKQGKVLFFDCLPSVGAPPAEGDCPKK